MCCSKVKLPLVLRQPPPPIRTHNGGSTIDGMMDSHLNTVPTLSKTEEEPNTEWVAGGSNCSYVSGQTRPNNFRKCELKPTNMESLPDDVIFEILVRVPAQDIYDATRLVCRKWYKIVHARDFIHSHLQQSPCGLLTQGQGLRTHHLTFIASLRVEIEIFELNYKFRNKTLSSCNGLLLERHDNSRDLYITNPATKQHFALPPVLNNVLPYGYALTYAATSFEYKVVCAFFHHSDDIRSLYFGPQDDCVAVLTVGVDKEWMCRVKTQHLSITTKKLLLNRPITTEGFVHWAKKNTHSEHVLTLNVETEIFAQFPVPSYLRRRGGETKVIYLPMGSSLSLFVSCSDFSWDFWEMNPETGDWTKMPSIDLEDQFANARNYMLTPVGWSRPREVLVFSVSDGPCFPPMVLCYVCNVRTRQLEELKLDDGINNCFVHRNSLVWMDG